MRTISLISLLGIILLSSCSSFDSRDYFQEVAYASTTIASVDDRTINFTNGMVVKSNRLIIAVNSTPVLLVIENYTGSGYFYLRNSKINFSSGNTDIESMGVQRGRIQYLQSIDKENRTIKLADDSEWYIPMDEHWASVDDWLTRPELIIPYNKPPKGEFFINTATSESVLGIRTDEPNTN